MDHRSKGNGGDSYIDVDDYRGDHIGNRDPEARDRGGGRRDRYTDPPTSISYHMETHIRTVPYAIYRTVPSYHTHIILYCLSMMDKMDRMGGGSTT